METKMQTSFIPKKPITDTQSSGGGISLFLLLGIILFIVSVALAGGVYMWKDSLVKQIEQDKISLESTKSKYEETTINVLVRLNDRLKVSEDLLAKHVAVSPIFTLLEKNTLQSVRLKTLKFSSGADNKIKLDITGNARNYGALSKQSDAFGAESLRKFITQPMISDFSLATDGTVNFTFTTLVTPNLISYSNI